MEVQIAPPTVAQALHIEAGAQVVSRHQQRFIDDTMWSLQTSYYPMTLVTEKGATRLIQATDIPEGAVEYLAKECGIQQVGYRDSISVRAPDELEFDETGERIRLTVTVYPTDRNRFVINVGDTPPIDLKDEPS